MTAAVGKKEVRGGNVEMGRKIKDSFLLGLIYLTSFLSVILLAGILLYVFHNRWNGCPSPLW